MTIVVYNSHVPVHFQELQRGSHKVEKRYPYVASTKDKFSVRVCFLLVKLGSKTVVEGMFQLYKERLVVEKCGSKRK